MRWHETFVAAGAPAPIYARRFDEHHRAICAPLSAYEARPGDVLLFHYTTWTETADFLLGLDRRLVLMYHNVTPPSFFAGLDPGAEAMSRLGRERLANFAPLAPLAIAKSTYSQDDLRAAGFATVGIVPVRIDFATLESADDPDLRRQLARAGTGILTIGRVVPNKGIDDLIKVFAYYRAWIDPTSRLYCVGAHDERGSYQAYLGWLVRRLKLDGAVVFTGQVANAARGAYLRAARAFVTLSEHEGFCVPAVESMLLGLPVVAFAGTAIPETVGDGAVLVTEKHHRAIAEVLGKVCQDGPLRAGLIERGRRQAARYATPAIEARLLDLLESRVAELTA